MSYYSKLKYSIYIKNIHLETAILEAIFYPEMFMFYVLCFV